MYFPFLRGKQFEIEALLEVPSRVYSNTLPIIEPVNLPRRKLYKSLADNNIPFILITNPFHPAGNRVITSEIQVLVDTDLSGYQGLSLGFIIDNRFSVNELANFFANNSNLDKVIIFNYNPLIADLIAIQNVISANRTAYIVFDEKKTNYTTRNAFSSYSNLILLTDGFQRELRNADYPPASTFDSYFASWATSGWAGIGDYATIGDHFNLGGGQVYVVTLHVTIQTTGGLEVRHFSSTFNPTVQGFSAQKFAEANSQLVTSPYTLSLLSSGLDIYRDLDARNHNPQLGVAKKHQ
ncbi:sce7725 family protein [Pedobacter sp. P26]|uniref:sce7725 family protein n=1 Tax=Pedobacter sp. P26 TaxID=3423956 RepID=UPI003D67CC63